MATIKETKHGTHHARIQKRNSGAVVFDKSKNFSTYALAKAWSDDIEAELAANGITAANSKRTTFAELTQMYFDRFDPIKEFGRNKRYHLRQLADGPLGSLRIDALTTKAIMDFAHNRQLGGTGPATINQDLVWIKVVCKHAPAFGLSVNMQPIEDAVLLLRSNGQAARAESRKRRPTNEELARLSDYFLNHKSKTRQSAYPMYDLMWFAIHSARRASEITRLEKADDNINEQTGMVRDAKHPRNKKGNHRRFRYTDTAWQIIQNQQHDEPLHFPYSSKTIGSYFRQGCKFCGIDGLRFHDLRHEATSRLFEDQLNIPDVAAITLHETWEMLRRYTHLSQPKERLNWAPQEPEIETLKR